MVLRTVTGAGMWFTKIEMRGLAYFWQDQEGNSFFEHALLASLAAMVCLIALMAISKGP